MFRLAFLLLLASCASKTYRLPECVERRSVIEMGTSRIKLTIADVDVCKKTFLHTVAKMNWRIEQDRHLHEEYEGSLNLSHESMNLSLAAIKEGMKSIDEYPQTSPPILIATGVFREVTNLESFFKKIEKISGSRPLILSAIQEARLGVRSVQATELNLPEQFIVWDIGGNSMQLSLRAKKKSRYFLGGKGSQFYKKSVMQLLNRKKSPNPVGHKNIDRIKEEFKKTFSLFIPKVPDNLAHLPVYGIGAVHSESVLRRMQELNETKYDVITAKDLNDLIVNSVNLSDGQIGGDYSANQVVNQILVESMMEYLGIKVVNVRTLDLTQGALVYGIEN
jgi:exopolyphosphatase / guanosine-5'-triphosphate,3'-diphosphate pyrophosphatase